MVSIVRAVAGAGAGSMPEMSRLALPWVAAWTWAEGCTGGVRGRGTLSPPRQVFFLPTKGAHEKGKQRRLDYVAEVFFEEKGGGSRRRYVATPRLACAGRKLVWATIVRNSTRGIQKHRQ